MHKVPASGLLPPMLGEPLDWVTLRAQCAADEALVEGLLTLFIEEGEALLADVGAAVEAGDPAALKATTHRLRGALMALAAQPSIARALALEQCAAGDLGRSPALFRELQDEVSRLLKAIARSG